MKIPIAVVPVAGLGTRLLPATKSQPKEMLPVAKKPLVQYVVEELQANGVRQIVFITGRSKTSIENHFDFDHEWNDDHAGTVGPAVRHRGRAGSRPELEPDAATRGSILLRPGGSCC